MALRLGQGFRVGGASASGRGIGADAGSIRSIRANDLKLVPYPPPLERDAGGRPLMREETPRASWLTVGYPKLTAEVGPLRATKLSEATSASDPLTIFVHGAGVDNRFAEDQLAEQLRLQKPAGAAYLIRWPVRASLGGAAFTGGVSSLFRGDGFRSGAERAALGEAGSLRDEAVFWGRSLGAAVDDLIQREGAGRPVTVVGFSAGAQVVLSSLAQRPLGSNVERVVLLGGFAPAQVAPEVMANLGKASLINAFSPQADTDIGLGAKTFGALAGSSALVTPTPGAGQHVLNIETNLRHMDYWSAVPSLLALGAHRPAGSQAAESFAARPIGSEMFRG